MNELDRAVMGVVSVVMLASTPVAFILACFGVIKW